MGTASGPASKRSPEARFPARRIGRDVMAMPIEGPARPGSPFFVIVREEEHPLPLDADMHGYFEVGILTSGGQEWHFEDTMTIMERGDVYLTASWEPHGWRVLEPSTRTVQLTFLPEAVGDEILAGHPWQHIFAVHPSERPRVTGRRMREEVLAVASDIEREVREQRPAWLEAARLGLFRLLLALAREWRLPIRHKQQSRVRATDLERIMPVFDLVRTSPERRVSRKEAAQACALSTAQFGVVFRRAMGVTFGHYALRARLVRAAYLLLQTDLSVEEIAGGCGFADGSHLSRIFHKHYGAKPADYRAQRRRVDATPRPSARKRRRG